MNISVSEWDADGDGSEFEFTNAIGVADLLTQFDSDDDDLLGQPELSAGLFGFAIEGFSTTELAIVTSGYPWSCFWVRI